MPQTPTQQLDPLIPELTGCEVQRLQRLVDFEGQGEVVQMLSEIRTRPQPVGYMGESHSPGMTETLQAYAAPKDCILDVHLILLQYVANPGLKDWRELISLAFLQISPWPFNVQPHLNSV